MGYYFGGSFESISINPNMPPTKGLRMTIGKAISTDNGRSWERLGQVLDYDPVEGIFASWPRIIRPLKNNDGKDDDEQPWRMVYHAFNGTRWAVFEAKSYDQGETLKRDGKGMAIGPGKADGWDGCGIGREASVELKMVNL